MAWSYDRLWFLLIKKKIKRTDLIALAGLNSTAISKMGKDQPVSLEIIGKLCKYFNCRIEDLVEYVPDANNAADTNSVSVQGKRV